MIVHCLAVFNIIFALQTLLDVIYLCGGAALPRGLTYASYAHRGSYPLIAAALLAAAFVIVTFRPGRTRGAFRLVAPIGLCVDCTKCVSHLHRRVAAQIIC